MSREISWKEINNDFSSSYCDDNHQKIVEEIIESFLGFKPDGSMVNLNTFPILLDNVLNVFEKESVKLEKKKLDNGCFMLKMKVVLN